MKKNPLRKYFLSVYNISSNDDVINYLAIFYQENLNRISTMRNPKSRLGKCLILLVLLLTFLETEGVSVEITYLNDAVAKGAVCLDGSPPAYHFDRGSGAGINNWLIQIEGGAWCHNVESCFDRKHTSLGSSKIMQKHMNFSGILSNRQQSNPDFYNWNRIKVRYCDGSSFTGDVENVDPTTNLYFRGARVWLAVMEDLLAKGMKNAENAILSGCSAGGLTSVLHCDNFRALLPTHAKVKCVSDAGFFIHTKDISGVKSIEAFYNGVVATHGSVNHLPQSCTARMKPELCFFPQYAAHRMQTPLFIINSAYDSWQIQNILVPMAADPHMEWLNCKRDLNNCTVSQFKTIQDFRQQFLSALSQLCNSSSRGMFIDSCYTHCQTESQHKWLSNVSVLVQNTPISKAAGDWFYERGAPNQLVDCPYPCNPTCHRNSSHVLQEPELQIFAGDKDYLEVS